MKAFEEANPTRPGPTCTVCRLPEHVRAFIVEGRKRGSTLRSIAAVIASEGHATSHYTIGRHMRDGHGG